MFALLTLFLLQQPALPDSPCEEEPRPGLEAAAEQLHHRGLAHSSDGEWEQAAISLSASVSLLSPCDERAIELLLESAELHRKADQPERARAGLLAAADRALGLRLYLAAAEALLAAAELTLEADLAASDLDPVLRTWAILNGGFLSDEEHARVVERLDDVASEFGRRSSPTTGVVQRSKGPNSPLP